jgi:hypothetical protein
MQPNSQTIMSNVLQLSRVLRLSAYTLYRHGALLDTVFGQQLCVEFYDSALACANFLDGKRGTFGHKMEKWCGYYVSLLQAALADQENLRASQKMTNIIALLRTVASTLRSYAPQDTEVATATRSAVLTPHVIKLAITQGVPPDAVDLYTLAAVASLYHNC